MKKNVLIAVALFATMTASAQNIAVVSPNNETKMCQTLDEAITDADDGSIIYLPGGGFRVEDDTKITKKLTIMGVSHRGDTDNADGATVIAGSLNFEKGSSGSSVIGAFISGNINVGTGEDMVNNLTIRFCNARSIQVKNSQSSGMVVNQSYMRENCNFGNCDVRLENNILFSVQNINGGIIDHNIIVAYHSIYANGTYSFFDVNNSSITNNFIIDNWGHRGSNCYVSNNCAGSQLGDECIVLDEGTTWDDVFVANKGVKISSDYHLQSKWGKGEATDGSDIGIYGGSSFKDGVDAHAPIPRIISKKVDEQTDGSGKLHIQVTIKAQ